MRSQDLEDLTLLLLRETNAQEIWLDRWAVSYPCVQTTSIRANDSPEQWRTQVQNAWQRISSQNIAVIAHSAAAAAFLAWHYHTDILSHKRIQATILVSPPQNLCQHHEIKHAICNHTAALVIGQNDPQCPRTWAAQQAQQWRAQLLEAPQQGHLNEALGGWQWGMKLLQEMLLSS